jgi:hypothetical protein
VTQVFGHLRGSVQRNLAVVAVAFLRLLSGARSGHGRLSLGALFRVLPTAGTAHAREKRLRRFLENPRLDPRGVTSGLAQVVFGERGEGWWPIARDQTHSEATQALLAGVPFQRRTLPLAVSCLSGCFSTPPYVVSRDGAPVVPEESARFPAAVCD